MVALANGDKAAFDTLYERYHQRLYYTIYKIVLNREDANDLLHDIFIKIIEHPAKFDATRKFSSWLFSIGINAALNKIKKKKEVTLNGHNERCVRQNSVNTVDLAAFKHDLELHVSKLDAQNRALYTLRFKHNLSIKEIAGILDCKEGTVKSRLFYMNKKLATALSVYKLILEE